MNKLYVQIWIMGEFELWVIFMCKKFTHNWIWKRERDYMPTDLWIMGEDDLCVELKYGLRWVMCKYELWVKMIYV